MSELLFNSENLKGISENLKVKLEEFTTVLNNMKSNLSNIEPVWSSEAQTIASEKIEAFFKNADEINEKISVYIEFLNKTISEYEKADNSGAGGK
jgi:uncharacterized protein YukE